MKPFATRRRRITAELAGIRNRLITAIADAVLAHEDHQLLLATGAVTIDSKSMMTAPDGIAQ